MQRSVSLLATANSGRVINNGNSLALISSTRSSITRNSSRSFSFSSKKPLNHVVHSSPSSVLLLRTNYVLGSNGRKGIQSFLLPKKRGLVTNSAESQIPHSSSSSTTTKTSLAEGARKYKFYHTSSVILAGLVPVAMFLTPSILNTPVDILLGIAVPIHMHIGCGYVIKDYVPRNLHSASLSVMWFISFITFLGLLKINVKGQGITTTVKSLWSKPSSGKQEVLRSN